FHIIILAVLTVIVPERFNQLRLGKNLGFKLRLVKGLMLGEILHGSVEQRNLVGFFHLKFLAHALTDKLFGEVEEMVGLVKLIADLGKAQKGVAPILRFLTTVLVVYDGDNVAVLGV